MTGKHNAIMIQRGTIVTEYLNNHSVDEESLNGLKKIILKGYIALTNFIIILHKARNNPQFVIATDKYKRAQEIRLKQKIEKWKKRGFLKI